jgi:hypothetical protein
MGAPEELVIQCWEAGNGRNERTALPSADEPCTQEFAPLLWGQPRHGKWVVSEKIIEFEHVLEEITKCKETAIYSPRSPVCNRISLMAHDNDAGLNLLRARIGVLVETNDRRVRDSVQEAETVRLKDQTLKGRGKNSHTVHGRLPSLAGRLLQCFSLP